VVDDIVTRLQCIYDADGCGQCTFCLAKAEIESLRAEVDMTSRLLYRFSHALGDIIHLTQDRQVLDCIKEARRD